MSPEDCTEEFVGINTTTLPASRPIPGAHIYIPPAKLSDVRYAYDPWFYSMFAPVNASMFSAWIPVGFGPE